MSGDESEPIQSSVEQSTVDEGMKSLHISLELGRRKRASKRDTTKVRHQLEKSFSVSKATLNKEEIEHRVEHLWSSLEQTQNIMDELSVYYLGGKDGENQKAIMKESNELELECQQAIEKAHAVLISGCFENNATVSQDNDNDEVTNGTSSTGSNSINEGQAQPAVTSNTEQQAMQGAIDQGAIGTSMIQQTVEQNQSSSSSPTHTPLYTGSSVLNRHLKPLRVPDYDGNKAKFEDFWSLFESLVDKSNEPVHLKMARLRQSLSGRALEAIRGLGVSPEYDEAKEIIRSKFGGQRRQLRGYMDELENMPTMRNNDVNAFEKFADLVRVTVAKLKAENRESELGEGTLHRQLVKKLSDRQLESYSRWLSTHSKEQSVICLCDWLKEEVTIKVEAAEMAYGLEQKYAESKGYQNKGDKPRFRSYRTGKQGSYESYQPNMSGNIVDAKPPCAFCGRTGHGIWSCHQFQQRPVLDRWKTAKEKQLCFRCLATDHHGKDCRRSRQCNIGGCQLTHHRLLHDPEHKSNKPNLPEERVELKSPREGVTDQARVVTTTTGESNHKVQMHSLRTIPVWIKANGTRIKVNAVLDDASNETFLNEEVAGFLGLSGKWQDVQVHVLNDAVETFKSIPLQVEIESTDRQFSKEINVITT